MASGSSESYHVIMKGTTLIVCQDYKSAASRGIWKHSNPLKFATPLLLLQLSMISLTTVLIDFCLQPLGQSTIVSKIFQAGIVFGPSLLGHEVVLSSRLFPPSGAMVMETFATFGLMFFFFQVGVQMDSSMMVKPGRIAMAIGISVMFFTLSLGIALSLLLKTYVPMDDSLASSLPFIAAAQSLTPFPNIACLLTELKILNTDLGRLAISSSMFCDVIGIALTAVGFSMIGNSGTLRAFFAVLSTVALVVVAVYFFRPTAVWFQSRTPEGKVIGEKYMSLIFTMVIVAGFASEAIGQHFILGPLIFGLVVPEGPPLGAAIVAKLDSLVSGILTDQEFTLSVISVIVVTGITTPLIRFLYDPSRHQLPIKRKNIQQAKRDAELRILVCIHNQDNVPSIVNLLEASNATEESPIVVTALLLVELAGRSTPMLIAHQRKPIHETNTSSSRSGRTINAFHHYELYNEGRVTVQTFSAISHFETMHEDIFRMALNQNVTIVIVPFHKIWAIDGSIGSTNRAIQNMNIKVLNKAPCSVGILIDRGILNGSSYIFHDHSAYRVAVIYIGGPDDIESLSYGARMANHENVTLTIFRILLFGSDSARERKLDNDLINQVRRANAGNECFSYQEEVVRDGVGLAACIRRLEDCFDLIIVGRHHQESALLQGLGAWSECPELGVIGDMLASPDFGMATSVLVVQQQRVLGGKVMTRATKPSVRDVIVPGRPSHGGGEATTPPRENATSWAISMDRT
ncbi:hypothetical protein HYC85_013749 [Camellia sinensis]|uniref:Cation/H+ exchanger domain-containing protein n=1 Tax=Camellia sinensis TaxID=4442 RepID=A0A7J7H479_CAMSI|nr:hypothetical protein HYC85_013749 [Camellia sinensis]